MIRHLQLTPTARLARQLAREEALTRVDEGLSAWHAPLVLGLPAWLARLRDDWLLQGDDDRVPIDAQQSLSIWQSLVDRNVFVGEPKVAQLAQRAWRLVHEHGLDAPERWPDVWLSDDSRQFRAWAAAYRRICTREHWLDEWTFASALPELIRARRLVLPRSIELVGFELRAPPLYTAILDACRDAGCDVVSRESPRYSTRPSTLLQCPEPDDELRAAAHWARECLERGTARSIAIVVPDLSGRIDDVERAFRGAFDPPDHTLSPTGEPAWHISLGVALAAWPLVADALALLALGPDAIDWPSLARLARSPFLAGWDTEAPQRAAALAELTRKSPYRLDYRAVRAALERSGATVLADAIGTWQAVRRGPAERSAAAWAERFQTELSALGFPRGRTLDSREYQVLARWHDLLEALGSLDVVATSPYTRAQAFTALQERARNAVFREQNPGAPVEILGVEEALGSRFDALWLTTFDADTWPGAPQRDPLVPARLQADVPRATIAGCLERAAQEIDGLCAAAATVRCSFSRGTDDAPRVPATLLGDLPIDVFVPHASPLPAPMQVFVDETGPALHSAVRGGTAILKNQSSCPFRAFAEARLGARALEVPRPGLDAAMRGSVLHAALEHFWRYRDGSHDLIELGESEALTRAIDDAATHALDALLQRHAFVLTPAGRRLEHRRCARALDAWLHVERQRGAFRVLRREHTVYITHGALELEGKIDRLDAVPDDDASDEALLLIDYKTGITRASDWAPMHGPREPQLPAYALALPRPPNAIAVAHLRAERYDFEGIGDGRIRIAGVADVSRKQRDFAGVDDWPQLLLQWRERLDALADAFVAGHAAVAPRAAQVCRHCHLHAFCRIREAAPAQDDEETGDE